MKRDRFLIGILIGILILVAAALALFFIHRSKQHYVSEDTPAGVVHNYILAIDQGGYERAYSYLADLADKPSYSTFVMAFSSGWPDMDRGRGVEIGETKIDGEQAIVELHIVYDSTDPFYPDYRDTERATLIRQNGNWKINAMDWRYWGWNWYRWP